MKTGMFERIRSAAVMLINPLKVRSIQFIITVSFIFVTILATLFVGLTLYNKFTRTAELNASINTQQIIEQVDLNLIHYLKNMMEISDLINFKIYINQNDMNSRFSEQLNAFLKTRSDIVSLAIFSNNGDLIAGAPLSYLKSNAGVVEQYWYKIAMEKPNSLFFSTPHVQNLFKGQHNWVVSLSRNITFYRMEEGIHGVLLVDMNFKAIDDLCGKVSLGKKGYIYIIDQYGSIIYHPQQQLIYAGLKEEKTSSVLQHSDGSFIDNSYTDKKLITIKTVDYTGWKIVGVSNLDEIVTSKSAIGNFVLLVLFFGILFVASVSAFISSKISQPIKRLEKSMRLVEQGNFDINVDVKGEDEVVQLSKSFNLMVSRIRVLRDQIVEEQEAKRKSELDALQAQINPHFLYNTLDSIVWMAENGKSRGVITMVTALARLFRISISKGENFITIQEELEHAKNYLIIQDIRYKNKFKYRIEAQAEILGYKTLKLILQPIIENSIYHGIEYMVDEGLIDITVSQIDDRVLLKVSDNGLGMSPKILENLLSTEPSSTSGVGIKNVNERIQLSFGKKYGIQVESELESGTTVSIWLPVMRE